MKRKLVVYEGCRLLYASTAVTDMANMSHRSGAEPLGRRGTLPNTFTSFQAPQGMSQSLVEHPFPFWKVAPKGAK